MVIMDERQIRLSTFGCEAFARTASYHTRDLRTEEGKENQDVKDLECQRFVNRLCAVSPTFAHSVRQIFPKNLKNGARLIFTDNYTEIACQQFSVKFIDSDDLVFFLEMIRPYFSLIHYTGTHLWRKHLIDISEALIGQNEVNGFNCFNADTFLKFDKLGNDNAYGTLIEFLGDKVKRMEIDDEFVNQVRNEKDQTFDFLKVKSQSRADTYYTKSYFDIKAKEFDLRNVCSLSNMLMYTIEHFEIQPQPHIEKITMTLLEHESPESIVNGSTYLHHLAPNLKRLTLIMCKGLIFKSPENAFQAAREINKFFTEKYKNMLIEAFPFIDVVLKLELSIYFHGQAFQKENINWVALIKEDYPELEEIVTEISTYAYQVIIPGNKDGDSVIVRIHFYEKEYNDSDLNPYPHAPPLQFN